jgi:hypothetical protein
VVRMSGYATFKVLIAEILHPIAHYLIIIIIIIIIIYVETRRIVMRLLTPSFLNFTSVILILSSKVLMKF